MKEKKPKNSALLNVIAPMGVNFTHTSIRLGEEVGKGYGIIQYASNNKPGWLSRITNIPSSIVSVTYHALNNDDMIATIDSNINAAKKRRIDAKKSSEENKAGKEEKNSKKLLEQIDDKNESIGLVSTVVLPLADEAHIEKVDRKAKTAVKRTNARMRCMVNMQKQCYKQISPTYIPGEEVQTVLGSVIPLRTILGGFPFQKNGLNDHEGYYFAKDEDGGIYTINLWKRQGDRTNSNVVFIGNSGVGKSTKMKDMLMDEYMMGSKVLIIDPEDEYKEQSKYFNGAWINAAGGIHGKINPLQIYPIPVDDEDEYYADEGYGMGPLALYLKHLETFFNLYSESIDDYLMAYLKQVLIELYKEKGITFDTDVTNLKNEEFPIIEELVMKLKEKEEQTKGMEEKDIYRRLSILLWDMAYGSDAFLFNGYTSIAADNAYTCISTSGLNDASNRIKRAQYFNLLTWAWHVISRNRSEKVILVCDEAYLLVDPEIPQSLIFLRNSMKRARKYEAAIWVITQNTVDFLNEEVKMYGQELLDNPTFKILMGIDGANLEKIIELYRLTEQEVTLLEAKRRGHAVMLCGSRRMHVVFDIADYKFQYFGSAGGR